jgi:hypothetical protein
VRFLVDKVALVKGFLLGLRYASVSIVPPMLHIYSLPTLRDLRTKSAVE